MHITGVIKQFSFAQQSVLFIRLGFSLDFENKVKNILRNDNEPNCRFILENEIIKLQDFGSDIFGNCIEVYSRWKNVSSIEAIKDLNKLLEDDNQVIVDPSLKKIKSIQKKKTEITYKLSYKEDYYDYFNQYYISYATLRLFKVAIGIVVIVEGINQEIFRHTQKEPCFLYFNKGEASLYRPLSTKSKKWRKSNSYLQGIEQIDKRKNHDLIIITKSLKDVMVLYELGFTAISPISETIEVNVFELHEIFNCKRFVVLYDNDEAGRKAAKKLTEQGISMIEIPYENRTKDVSDYIKLKGKEETLILLNQLL